MYLSQFRNFLRKLTFFEGKALTNLKKGFVLIDEDYLKVKLTLTKVVIFYLLK